MGNYKPIHYKIHQGFEPIISDIEREDIDHPHVRLGQRMNLLVGARSLHSSNDTTDYVVPNGKEFELTSLEFFMTTAVLGIIKIWINSTTNSTSGATLIFAHQCDPTSHHLQFGMHYNIPASNYIILQPTGANVYHCWATGYLVDA